MCFHPAIRSHVRGTVCDIVPMLLLWMKKNLLAWRIIYSRKQGKELNHFWIKWHGKVTFTNSTIQKCDRERPTDILLHYYNYNHFTPPGLCLGLSGWAGTKKGKIRKVKPIWVCWSKRQLHASPIKFCVLIEEVRTICAPPKYVCVRHRSFAAGCAKNMGKCPQV